MNYDPNYPDYPTNTVPAAPDAYLYRTRPYARVPAPPGWPPSREFIKEKFGVVLAGELPTNLRGIPEYSIWASMWDRCTNPKNPHFEVYKDRRPVDSWTNFMVFYLDMGPRPSPKHSLDRIDNAKGYAPDNCRWATGHEQGNNRSNNLKISHNGRTMGVQEWAEVLGKSYECIYSRLKKHPVDVALSPDFSSKTHPNSKILTYNGVTKSLSEWAESLGVPKGTLQYRLRVWGTETALSPVKTQEALKQSYASSKRKNRERSGKKLTFEGKTQLASEWCDEFGIPVRNGLRYLRQHDHNLTALRIYAERRLQVSQPHTDPAPLPPHNSQSPIPQNATNPHKGA